MSSLIGKSENIENIRRLVKKAAQSHGLPVFISGESGSGKELIAREIWKESGKKDFVALNCGAIPRELIESELFGYEKGAFTGAVTSYNGKIRDSHDGILFLDEIGELELYMQPRFLRVLQEKEVTPVGSSKRYKVDFLLIAATNKDINEMVSKGEFRKDLYYRLDGININILPLRDRKEDIMPLCEFFLKVYSEKIGKKCPVFGNNLKKAILGYNWPGNVRQLQAFVEREVFFSEDGNDRLEHIPDFLMKKHGKIVEDWNIFSNERKLIENCLKHTNWNICRASELLGISRATLYRKLKEYEIQR